MSVGRERSVRFCTMKGTEGELGGILVIGGAVRNLTVFSRIDKICL